MQIIARSIRITGSVQGVAYRKWTQARAQQLGLSGWVRNKRDGSVQAHAQGEREAVETLINEMWSGPGAAIVRDVQTIQASPEGALTEFKIKHA